MTNERCYFAQKDFEAYNPHHDLKNPIKIKKYDLLLCNGGMPEQMLLDNGVIEEKQSFILGDYTERFVDFRTLRDTRNNKDIYNDCLLNGVAQVPLFYWLEDYVNQPSNRMCTTKDIFGNEIELSINKPCKNIIFSLDGTFIGFIEWYKTKKVDLAEIKKDILTVANKAVEEFEKAVNVILARYDT